MQTKESRQIIIEIAGDGKTLSLRKDETASIFERNAFLSAIIQSPDIPIIPLAEVKDPPENLANKTNEKENGKSNPTTGGKSNGKSNGGRSKRGGRNKNSKQ